MIEIKLGNIVDGDVDVIVNATDPRLSGGGGVDAAIHQAAGPSVMEECRKIEVCPTGRAIITEGGKLRARRIIHTVGPIWHGGKGNEAGLLEEAYVNSFELARNEGLRSIAFPAISTGVFGYPREKAARIALSVGHGFGKYFDRIVYVCFSEESFDTYNQIRGELDV
jgi:O-acetyl-ADP-ribose deacetylase